MDLRYVLGVELTVFPEGFDVEGKKKKWTESNFRESDFSNWMDDGAIQ